MTRPTWPQVALLKTNIDAVVQEWEDLLTAQREALMVAESSVVDLRRTLQSILTTLAPEGAMATIVSESH